MAQSHSNIDILHGSLWRNIPLFALPVAITGILEQLSNLIDTLMIRHFSPDGGTLGMAAVGSTTPIATLLIMLFVGLSLGANVTIAHAVGAGNRDRANRCAHTAVVLALLGVVVTILMEIASRPLMQCLSVPPEIFNDALVYLRVYLLGIPAILLFNFEAAVFRSVGVTRMPLMALAISAALNVVLDGIFVAFLGWGAAGVALATVLCYIVSSGFLFTRLLKADEAIRIDPRRLRIDRESVTKIVRIGLPAGIQGSVFSLANILIQTCINSLGAQVVAASSAALALEFVCYSLLNSFSQACTTFVGQNNGAGNLSRCKDVLKVALIEDAIITVVMTVLVVWQGRTILTLFSSDAEVLDIAYVRVCTLFPAYVFSMVYENMSGYLRGFGISVLPSALTALGVCGTRFFWVLAVFPANPTFATVLLAYPVSFGVTAALITGALVYCRPASKETDSENAVRAHCI